MRAVTRSIACLCLDWGRAEDLAAGDPDRDVRVALAASGNPAASDVICGRSLQP